MKAGQYLLQKNAGCPLCSGGLHRFYRGEHIALYCGSCGSTYVPVDIPNLNEEEIIIERIGYDNEEDKNENSNA